MKGALLFLVNGLFSVGAAIGTLYWAPGYAPAPREVIAGINEDKRAISKLSESLLEVVKRQHMIAPPEESVGEAIQALSETLVKLDERIKALEAKKK